MISRLVASVFFIAASAVWAQGPLRRIAGPIDEGRLQTLPRNVHPLARANLDHGIAPADLPMQRMLMVLDRTQEQEAALQTFLRQVQDRSSPAFHRWLSPQEFGARFGAADSDIQTVTAWLQSHGFTVNRISNRKTIVEFSGNAMQVQQAFHTEIHKYVFNGEEHWANASDPQIPLALTPV